MKFNSDIDIDMANRDLALAVLDHTPASILRDSKLVKHNTGIHVTDIPVDPELGISAIEYKSAQDRGYIKLDLLNVGVYQQISSEAELDHLMTQEPEWERLYDPEFCQQVIHIGGHYETLIKMPEAVNSIVRLAMFLAIIRPAKRHLIGLSWQEVAKTIWEPPEDGGYHFKCSHSVAYAHLVVVHMNLLTKQFA
jgi:hypothetical protein